MVLVSKLVNFIRNRIVLFITLIYSLAIKYLFAYDKLVIYIGDQDTNYYRLRRYRVRTEAQVVESVVSGIRDLKSTTPPDHFKVYSEALIELLEKHKT